MFSLQIRSIRILSLTTGLAASTAMTGLLMTGGCAIHEPPIYSNAPYQYKVDEPTPPTEPATPARTQPKPVQSLSLSSQQPLALTNQSLSPRSLTTTVPVEPITQTSFSSAIYIDLFDRLRDHYGFDPQLYRHANGKRRIHAYRQRYSKIPHHLRTVLNRSRPYLHYIVTELEKRDMPAELALLPVIESAYDPYAYSHSKAAGLWQFISGTADMYGVEQNRGYDGRRDLIDSTQAALNYLSYLHNRFNGDWLHALAAYNAGSGTISKAIRRNQRAGKPIDYWSLKLPRETEHYVPKLLAVADIVRRSHELDVAFEHIPNTPTFSIISTNILSNANSSRSNSTRSSLAPSNPLPLSLTTAATMANIDLDQLKALNPGFNHNQIPASGPHRLLIPIRHASHFIHAMNRVNQKIIAHTTDANWHRHQVQEGENLSTIAQKFNVSVGNIALWNDIEHHHLIHPGQALKIFVDQRLSD